MVPVLRGAGQHDLASEVLARACALGEAGARAERVAELVAAAWSAHAEGERERAISLLERAKSLHAGSAG